MGNSQDVVADASKRRIELMALTPGAELQTNINRNLVPIPKDIVRKYKCYVGTK